MKLIARRLRPERTAPPIARYSEAQVALLGCTNCGLVTEGATVLTVGHLTKDACPDCGTSLRVVGLAEADQLTRERFLATHWREIAAKKRKRQRPETSPG